MYHNVATSHDQDVNFWLADIFFVILALAYALLACYGILAISANGVVLDSDLQTYAQGMAGKRFPDLFINDPVLHSISQANNIPNLQRWLAGIFATQGNYGAALLRAGSVCIFVFYLLWYILGRWLFKYPAWAASLALAASITVWIGWGTFWGVTHSDPVPRVFFAAIFPLLLLLFFNSLQIPWMRPVCLFLTGCAIWVHGISSLNCGAMFFLAYVFIKPVKSGWPAHLNNTIVTLIAFSLPVLAFLWPSLSQNSKFSPEELAFFRDFLNYRWQKDYSDFWERFHAFLSPANNYFFLFIAGLIGWIALIFKGNQREKAFSNSLPFFIIALFLVALFSWAENFYSQKWGRLPLGHELVRGLRFIVPLAWIAVIGAFSVFSKGKLFRRIILIIFLGLILCFNADRQYMAAQYELGTLLNISLPLSAEAEKEKAAADSLAALLAEIKRLVPENEFIFSNAEVMSVRYVARRPLFHSFKDGYAHYYNKDIEKSRQWLDVEKNKGHNINTLASGWLKSGAPWFLGRDISDKQYFSQFGKIMYDKDGWILIKRDN